MNIVLTAMSGQAFRWDLDGTGVRGVDGDSWFRVTDEGDSWCIHTNADASTTYALFNIGDDYDKMIREILSIEPRLSPIISGLPGLRIMKFSDPIEVLFGFLCSANNHIPRIRSLVRALARRGSPHTAPFAEFRFPSLETLAEITECELRAEGFGYRAATIPLVAKELIARGSLEYLSGLKEQTYRQAHDSLVSLPGVGPKLADCISLFGLHQCESVPVDTHVWQATIRLYRPEWAGKSVTASRYREIGDLFRDKFGNNAAIVQQFLFYDNHLQTVQRRSR